MMATGRFMSPLQSGGTISPAWEAALAAHGIPIESRVRWSRGGESIYFRDPDGHSVELATPGVWATY